MPNGAAALQRAGEEGRALRRSVTRAEAFAERLAPKIEVIRADGHRSLHAIAAELTARGIRIWQGGAWGVSNVNWDLGMLEVGGGRC